MAGKDDFKGCGSQLKKERQRLGYTRERIAERAGISPRYLAAIELEEKIPKADVMIRIIRAMGISADNIIYMPQQDNTSESDHLAWLLLQCTPKERRIVAAIIDTMLDDRRQDLEVSG